MTDLRRACLIYVAATAGGRPKAIAELESQGYIICEVLAETDDALAAKAGEPVCADQVRNCIEDSDLCVVLLPDEPRPDALIGSVGVANGMGKRVIVITHGTADIPVEIDDLADSVLAHDSGQLADAIRGSEVWEAPSATPGAPRTTPRVKCQ